MLDINKIEFLLNRYYEEILLHTSAIEWSSIENFSSDDVSARGTWRMIANYTIGELVEIDANQPDLGFTPFVYHEKAFTISWPNPQEASQYSITYTTDLLDNLKGDFFGLDDDRVTDDLFKSFLDGLDEETIGNSILEKYQDETKIDYEFYLPKLNSYLKRCVRLAIEANS